MKKLIYILIPIFAFVACTKEANVPSYLKIDTVGLTNDLSDTQSIEAKDVWVYEDDNLIGVYELPCDVPILELGERNLSIATGIRFYGQDNIREAYSAYTWYDTTVTFEKEKTIIIQPKVTYKNSPILLGDFEVSADFLTVKNNGTISPINFRSNGAKYGDYMGELTIDANSTLKAYLKDSLEFSSAENLFFEICYTNEISMEIGVEVFDNGSWVKKPILLSIQPSTSWKKTYFDPMPYLTNVSSEGYFRIYMLVENKTDDIAVIQTDNWNVVK